MSIEVYINTVKKNNNTPISAPTKSKTEASVFVLKKQTEQKNNDSKDSEEIMSQKIQIQNKLEKLGLKPEELKNLCPEIANLYVSTSLELKSYKAINFALDKILKIKEVSPQADIKKIIKTTSSIYYKALEDDIVNKPEELDKNQPNINKKLGGKNFQKLNRKERYKRLKEYAKASRQEFEKTLQKELEKLPPEKREEAEKNLRERFYTTQRLQFVEFIAVQDSETGLDGILLLNAKDMGFGAKTLMETRCNKEEAVRVASEVVTYSHQEDMIKSYAEMGEEPNGEALQTYNASFTSYMTGKALNTYQEDYKKAREAFERGEGSPYMKEEYYTATAKGIGEGAYQNNTISNEEKAKFLAKWENDAQSFNDYETVTHDVKEKISNNPKLQSLYEKYQEQLILINNNSKSIKSEHTATSDLTCTKKAAPVNNPAETNPIKLNKELCSSQTQNLYKKYFDISSNLQQESLDAVMKKYDSTDIIAVIFANNNFKRFYPQIIPFLKNYSVQELSKITQHATTRAFFLVLRNITPDKASKLYNINERSLCFNERKLCEQELEDIDENRKYAYC